MARKKVSKPVETESPAKPKGTGTPPSQVRFTEDDKAKIEVVRVRFGFPSMATTLRFCVENTLKMIEELERVQSPSKRKR